MIEWQPIETAPKDGTRVLLGFERNRSNIEIGWWEDSEHRRFGQIVSETHEWRQLNPYAHLSQALPPQPKWWMPIPPLPVCEA